MKTKLISLALITGLGVSACTMDQDTQRTAAGSVLGGAAGLAAASALGLPDGWVAVSTIAGAAAGTVVARNPNTNTCAYADGRGGYVRRAC